MAVNPGRPYFFKYTSAKTAEIILTTGRLRYAAPGTLNDPFDAQLDLGFGFAMDQLNKAMMERYLQAINGNAPLPVESRDLFVTLLEVMRQNRHKLNMTDEDFIREMTPAIEQGSKQLQAYIGTFHKAIRDLWLSDAKLFCVSEIEDDPLMWAHYADKHRGVVIKLLALEEIDNQLCVAKPVQYHEQPPVLATLEEFVENNFSGKRLNPNDAWDKVFYSKQADWAYEREWRVVVPGEAPKQDYAYFKLIPQEIGAVIFGSKITGEDRKKLTEIVKAKYPHAELLHASLDMKSYGITIEG